MQTIVGGLIEPVHLGYCKVNGHDKELLLICNEEGKLESLPITCVVRFGSQIEPIAGTCFLCLADDFSGNFEGLPKSLFDHLKQIIDYDHKSMLYEGICVPIIDLETLKETFGGVEYV